MDFELSENQAAVMDALDGIFDDFRTTAPGTYGDFILAPELEEQLGEAGFYSLATTEGYGALGAAIMTYEAARLPFLIEVAAASIVAPMLGENDLPRPIALADDRAGAIRNLPRARTLLLLENGEAHVANLDGVEIETLTSALGYPFGTLKDPGKLITRSLGAGSGALLAKWWRVALASEAAGLMQAALDCTVDYVKQRKQFGRHLGSFQAIQHRLATDVQRVSGARWLAMRAAQSASDTDAALAALYCQDQMRMVVNDVHQFSGAQGLTLEYPLHLWTYRLKALQGELGGLQQQADIAAKAFEEDEYAEVI